MIFPGETTLLAAGRDRTLADPNKISITAGASRENTKSRPGPKICMITFRIGVIPFLLL